MRAMAALCFLFIASSVFALEDYEQQQLQERIKPIGSVRIEGQGTKQAEPVPTEAKAEKAESKVPGQATYDQFCATCHQPGLAGAPKFQDETDWKPRLAQKDLDGLTASAIKGINAMPPKGTCQSCSEQDIKDAIQYMLPKQS